MIPKPQMTNASDSAHHIHFSWRGQRKRQRQRRKIVEEEKNAV